MKIFALGFVIGAWLLQQQPILPVVTICLICGVTAVALYLYLIQSSPSAAVQNRSVHFDISILAKLSLAIVIGFCYAAMFAQYRLSDALPKSLEQQPIQIIGVVASLPQSLERGIRFEFDVEKVVTKNVIIPKHLTLNFYKNSVEDWTNSTCNTSANTSDSFHAGQRYQLTVKLKRPHGTYNPHGLDFEAWALERNIRATGTIKQQVLMSNFVWRVSYVVDAAREKVRDRMVALLGENPASGSLQALVIGDDSQMTSADWLIYTRTGINHLMSISGLHITMLASLAFALVNFLWRKNTRLTLKIPARKAAIVGGFVAALLYSLLAGFSIPTQRTLYMLTVFAVALWSSRHLSITTVLALALLIVTLLDPWAVNAPGFWLSFGAVAVMTYALGDKLAKSHWFWDAVKTQWAVTVGLMPVLLVLFNQISLISPLANAFAIPLVSLIIVPLSLIGSLLSIDSALHIAAWLMTEMTQLLAWLANQPLATYSQASPPVWAFLASVFGVSWLLLPRGFPLKWLGVIFILPLFLVQAPLITNGQMKVTILDVGQGLSVVVQTRRHTLLYDTGPQYSAQNDSGNRIIVPYLRGEGISRLNGLVVSHDDNDHSGGAKSVLAMIPVNWIISSISDANLLPFVLLAKHRKCYAGQTWLWDGVRFDVLYPSLSDYDNLNTDKNPKDNNKSCVVKVTSQHGSVLLTGDIEKESEAKLLERYGDALESDLMTVPHHGSKTSSSSAFLALVDPVYAVFTVGYLNRFGHPKSLITQRYDDLKIATERTDESGAVSFNFGTDITTQNWRDAHHRYWLN